MVYMIKDKYYIKVGRKFVHVNIVYNNNNITLKPNKKIFIEDDGKVKYRTIVIDEDFKNKFKPTSNNSYTNKHE